jgi:1-acyl-sn-glycerol-3-phosphate acyltransferase
MDELQVRRGRRTELGRGASFALGSGRTDWAFLETQKHFWNPLMDYWFRMEMEGWENLPPAPALLIGIHSGAPLRLAPALGKAGRRGPGRRKGFVKLAIRSGVPIVPVSTVGGPDSMPVLATGRRMAQALRLDRVARIKMFPIALQAPWGLSPALLPEIPLPTKIRTAFQEPIELDRDPERANDEGYVRRSYEEVCDSIQHGMDALARRRRLPWFG